jgi:hypothetical protein
MSSVAANRAEPEASVGTALVQAASLTADTVLPPPEASVSFLAPKKPQPKRPTGFAATINHIRYVLSENLRSRCSC